jgi:allantoinase
MRERGVKCAFSQSSKRSEFNPEIAVAAVENGHEIVGHGYRWIDYVNVPETAEREYISRSVASIERITGGRPVGWMSGRPSMDTRRLLVEEGGFLYDRDSLGDELPYWVNVAGKAHL